MRKVIAAINMTIDGYYDHTVVNANEVLHQHYIELLNNAGVVLYGRVTYQLMEYWKELAKNPSGEKTMDDFATVMNKIPKIVFSHTLKSVDWESATVATRNLEEEVLWLKKQTGKDIFIGSPSLIVALTQLKLIDEYQLCVHPVIASQGLPLFKNIATKIDLKLIKTKEIDGGAVVLYYHPMTVC